MNIRRLARQAAEVERAFGVTEIPVLDNRREEVDVRSKRARLEELRSRYQNCLACPLSATRKQVVFGVGDPEARLLFIGEAPGFDEDQQGEPFVGAAGQLLTKIIQAMKLSREQVYIANILKCRPPQNRNPLPSEIAVCSPILMAQIQIIRPQVICALGKFAAQTLLGVETPITRLRGKFHDWNGVRLMPTFHPAYLLRNPDDKKLVWEDMKLVMRELGIG